MDVDDFDGVRGGGMEEDLDMDGGMSVGLA